MLRQSNDYSCGPASVQALLATLPGLEVAQETLAAEMGTTP
jgi:predicted double-glycine peptidase